MDEQELNKKLAEWRELKDFRIYADHAGNYYIMQFIDPEHGQLYIVSDAFHLSLDAIFKWLVPKVRERYHIHFHSTDNKTEWRVVLSNASETIYGRNNEPALALCLAIEKLIDKEKL